MTSKSSILTAGVMALAFTTPVLADGFDNGSGMSGDQSSFGYGTESSSLPRHQGEHGARDLGTSGAVVNTSLSVIANRGGAASNEAAGVDRRSAALAHYARARTMLLESLAEFERARDIARPDLFINPQEWRSDVIDRAQDLDNLLNPRPREVSGGVQMGAAPTLIRNESSELKSTEVHGSLGSVHTPTTPRAEGRARMATAKQPRVIRLKSEKAVSTKTESAKTITEAARSESDVKVLKDETAKQVQSESKGAALERNVDQEAAPADLGLDSGPVVEKSIEVEKTVEKASVVETKEIPAAAKAAPAPEVKALDEAELRKRLKKLADEVQAHEQTSVPSDEPAAPLGGMSGQ